MTHEIETKVLDINIDSIQKKLLSLGAIKTTENRLIVNWFRPLGTTEGNDPWYLRVRSYSNGTHEVTWKAKSEILGAARKHKEINFTVSDPEKVCALFEEIGLEAYAHQEKDRISYSLKDWKFDIDQYPNMPAYMEIEGTSEEHIQEALHMLEITDHKNSSEGERTLIQNTYGLDWYNMKF